MRSLKICVVVLALSLTGFAGSARAAFGPSSFGGLLSGDAAGTTSAVQAGGHPYSFTTTVAFNLDPGSPNGSLWPAEPVKTIIVDSPPGLLGNPAVLATCTLDELVGIQAHGFAPDCPSASQAGVASIGVSGCPEACFPIDEFLSPIFHDRPVYNMVAPPGVPARLAFDISGTIVNLDAKVRSGSDYGVSIGSRNTPEPLPLLSTTVTLWGVPADPSHDPQRWCAGQGVGSSCPAGVPPKAFLRSPTSCTGPVAFGLRTDSWFHPGVFKEASFLLHQTAGEGGAPEGMTGCDQVPFGPSMSVAPSVHGADAPTGVGVDVSVPQTGFEDPASVSEADLRKVVVSLPEGVAVNPSVASGLEACTPAQIDLRSPDSAHCPGASEIGTAEVQTPALADPLEGHVYVASQGDNPFGSLLAVYLVAEGSGVVLKVAGHVEADPVTGRVTARFEDLPQQPVSRVKLSFFGGPRAALVTPSACGSSQSDALLEGWNGKSVTQATLYSVDCTPGLGGFSPSFHAGTVQNQAGAFSPFVLSFSREDGEQTLRGVQQTLAPGLSAKIAGVPLCSDADANAGACPSASQIGTVTVGAGAGPSPYFLGGKIFLTGGYNGGAFGEVVVVHALAGPFDLGTVVVRGSIRIDPRTAQAIVVSDPFPTIIQGIPVGLRRVDVSLDRPGFTFNPTNCKPLSIAGTLTGAQGASANVSSRFQAANCAVLPFHPSFKVFTKAKTSKVGGVFLDVKVTSGAGQANLGKVAVSLPKQLPSRLTTIQQACTAAVFAANPASCPAGSNIGIATATTPILANPVTGPVYLVSHGGAAFPDLVMILQGEGVTTQVTGSINIKGGVTSSAFDSIPDIPISAFELSLPQGPHSALGANLPAKAKGSLCGQSLTMPTTLTGQNGAQVKQSTKISVSGCPKAKKKTKAKKHKRVRQAHKSDRGKGK